MANTILMAVEIGNSSRRNGSNSHCDSAAATGGHFVVHFVGNAPGEWQTK
jgi:hypothetical protein